MISVIVPVKKDNYNLKKILLSILLQNCIEKIEAILVFNSENTMNYYENEIKLFSEKLKLNCYVAENENLRQYGLKMCKTKYVTFLRINDFFYDAFSINCLVKKMYDQQYDFVFGEYVEMSGNNDYSNINNCYLSACGKLFSTSYLKKNNILITDDGDFDFDFVSKCFLLTKKYVHVDDIICVNNSFESDIFSNIKDLVNKVVENYNLYEDKINRDELNNYVFYNFDYINGLFVRNIFRISFDEFQKVITPLEKLYRKLIEEV